MRTIVDSARKMWEQESPGRCDICQQERGRLEPGCIVNGLGVGYVCSECVPTEISPWEDWPWAGAEPGFTALGEMKRQRDEARRLAEAMRDGWADEHGSDPEGKPLPWEGTK